MNHIDRDDWDQRELDEGDAYGVTCANVFDHVLADLQTIEVMLSVDKRAVVEVTILLELAARLAANLLQFSADDFGVSACECFTRAAG